MSDTTFDDTTGDAGRETLAGLLALTAAGDRRAFERLYRASSAHLFGLALHWVRDRELAADVLQESYVKIWLHAGEFRPDRAAPATWMSAIVHNQAVDSLRRAVRRPASTEPMDGLYLLADAAAGPLEQVERDEEAECLHERLGRLRGAQREAVVLNFFHGLSHSDVADRLDRPLGTVKSWLRRGLLELRASY